jgi:polar amino acid transport system permease protein
VTTESVTPAATTAPPTVKTAPPRRPGRLVTMVVLAVLLSMLINTLFTNDNFQWGVVRHYFFSSDILTGLRLTLELTVIAMVIGVVLGTVLAVMRLSENPVIVGVSAAYVWLFRGTPLLVQVIFWFNLSALYPRLSLGLPFGPEFAHGSANSLITPMVAAILALGLNEAAYMAEIIRGGILSVDQGQFDAARGLGMRRLPMMRLVVLPQAIRVIIPPTGNQVIGMLKYTSLVSVIALPELLYSAQLIYSQTFETIPLLIVASLWYLIVTTVLSIGQRYLERHFARDTRHPRPAAALSTATPTG